LDWRSPTLASIRSWALVGLVACPLAIIAVEIWLWRSGHVRSRIAGAVGVATLGVAALVLAATLIPETRFWWIRHEVLAADPAQLEKLGRHVVVGYRSAAELQALVERRAVAGGVLAADNAQGRPVDDLRRRSDGLQAQRRAQQLAPLWITTDQEGGAVSRLSPPLARSDRLSDVVARYPDTAERSVAVAQFGTEQGRALASVGVNVNFAPVVDLNHRTVNPGDRLTRIHERAISADPQIVTDVAGRYCAALWQHGVHCTLKHFPGLGRVFEDTHMESADLAISVS